VNVEGIDDVDLRMEIAKRADNFEADPEGFAREFEPAQAELRRRIVEAKKMLNRVTLDDDLLRTIASTCVDLGVKTHRAEIVISRTAKTIASFEGRTEANQEDVRRAMELALAHRMRSRPFEPPTLNKERLEKSMEKNQEHQKKQSKDQDKREEKPQERQEKVESDGSEADSHGQEKIFEIGDPIDVRQIDLLRRRDRTPRRKTGGRRMNTLAKSGSGRYIRSRMPQEGKDVAIDATIRAAAPYQRFRDGDNAIEVQGQDIREKERVRKTSAVVMFVVDASGSMGAVRRMESAKGAVLSMLMDSYQKRDKIGMIAFKGNDAELLLPPCSERRPGFKQAQRTPDGRQNPLICGTIQRAAAPQKRDDEGQGG